MKKPINIFTVCCAVLTLSTGVINAEELKIASVNIESLLVDYYRVPIEKAKLVADAERAKADEVASSEKLKKINEELVKLREEIEGTVTSKEEKMELTKKYQAKLQQGNAMNTERLAIFQRRLRAFEIHKNSLLKSMKSDIMKIVANYSEKEGYDLVVDRSGVTNVGLPSILYSKAIANINDEVLVILNDAAPAEKAAE